MIDQVIKSAQQAKQEWALSAEDKNWVSETRARVARAISGREDIFLWIVGPCSIHSENSALEYARRIKLLQPNLPHNTFLLMRCYLEKPRTRGGWPGFVYDPALDGSLNLEEGINRSRKLLKSLVEMRVPLAGEALTPLLCQYWNDVYTWMGIGARTVTSPVHRQLASQLPMPVGFKNELTGRVAGAIHSISEASRSHTMLTVTDNGAYVVTKTKGNPLGHLVLRGSSAGMNINCATLDEALLMQGEMGLQNRILVDLSHGNSGKVPNRQVYSMKETFRLMKEGYPICGMMLESHIHAGRQELGMGQVNPNISVTDPCLSWEDTEQLIYNFSDAHQEIRQKQKPVAVL